MATPSTGENLIAKVRRIRDVDTLQHESVPNVAEMLEMVSNFLQGRETPAEHTHAVFDSYQDWWLNQRPTFKLAIAEDNTLERLYEYIGTMYDLGIPLTLTEQRTPQIRLIQDVEIWAQRGSEGPLPVPVEEVISPQSAFMQMLREALHEVYPEAKFLDVVVFDATGVSKQKSSMKMSLRLVWPNVVVDRKRSVAIRKFLVHKFENSTNEDLQALGYRLAEQNPDNRWATIFSAAVHTAQHGVRMPLNDRVSPAPMKMLRPFRPHGVLRFNYADGAEKVELIAQSQDLGNVYWLKIGTIRRDAGTELTQWREPDFQRGQQRRAQGQLKLATRQGSGQGGGGGGGRARAAEAEEAPITVEHEFDGDVAMFREQLEAQLGNREEDGITQEESRLKWTQPISGATIEFRASNRRVYIVGTSKQVKSLLTVLTSFVRPVGDDTRSVVSSRAPTAHRAGSVANAPSAVYAPSAAFAPSAARAPSAAGSTMS